jgi:hypothetical protein
MGSSSGNICQFVQPETWRFDFIEDYEECIMPSIWWFENHTDIFTQSCTLELDRYAGSLLRGRQAGSQTAVDLSIRNRSRAEEKNNTVDIPMINAIYK